ncbi:MAG: hypothetical protein JWM27_2983, partial [Gemmatimonadetes bacterium]|nr:hypothetical protein [Gemmatimonadota bacterium]
AAPALAQAAPAPVSVAVGDSAVDGSRVRPARASFAWEIVRGEGSTPVGTLTDEVSVVQSGGRPALLRVLSLQSARGALIDSTVSDARTLAPISQRSTQPRRSIALTFERGRMTGSVTPVGGAPVKVDTAGAVPAFDSSSWDLVLRALPLREGLSVRYAVFDVDLPGQTWYSARVTGVERPAGAAGDAWRVETERGDGHQATVWIDRATREVVQVEAQMGPGVLLRQTRQR